MSAVGNIRHEQLFRSNGTARNNLKPPIPPSKKTVTKIGTPDSIRRKIMENSLKPSSSPSPNLSNRIYIASATRAYKNFIKICATMIVAGAIVAGLHPLIGVLIISIGLALCFLGTITFHIATKGRKEEERDKKLLAFPATSSDTQPEKTKTLSPADKKEQRNQARQKLNLQVKTK